MGREEKGVCGQCLVGALSHKILGVDLRFFEVESDALSSENHHQKMIGHEGGV